MLVAQEHVTEGTNSLKLFGEFIDDGETSYSGVEQGITVEEGDEARLAFVFVQPELESGAIHIDDVTFQIIGVPEPSGLLLGLMVIGLLRRNRRV